MKTRLLIFAVSTFLVCFSVMLTGCTSSERAGLEGNHADQTAEHAHQSAAEIETVKVAAKTLRRKLKIPAELVPFREVAIYPKVQGFVSAMFVDRGSAVKKGQTLVQIVAPELDANFREAQEKHETAKASLAEGRSRILSLLAQKDEAQSKLEAVEANYKRIQQAARTEGAVAPVDLETADKEVQGAKAHVRSAEQLVLAAQSELETSRGKVRVAEQVLNSVRETKEYLTIRAPFKGVVSERNVHEGSLVSSSNTSKPLLKLEEVSRLRLLMPVPEAAISGVKLGTPVLFSVSAFVGKSFPGIVSRISHQLDRKTRTMIVEVDVANTAGDLEPGMYAEVAWEMERPYITTFVPSTAVASKEDRTFVVVIRDAQISLQEVSRGQPMGGLVEIVGDIKEGDEVALHAERTAGLKGKIKTKLTSEAEHSKLSGESKED